MTLAQLLQLIETNLTRIGNNRITGPEIKAVALAIVNHFTQEPTSSDLLPPWTALQIFQLDGTDAGKYCTHLDDNQQKRIFESKVADNEGNEPPTDPDIHEDDYWLEVSPSAGSAIQEYKPGLHGAGLIIVAHNHSTQGRALFWLLEPERPFYSTDIEAETTAGKWVMIGGPGGGGVTANASETARGVVEEATAAEVQTAAHAGDGETGARLFISIPKLWSWFTYIRTQAWTWAAQTFANIKISGQAATESNLRPLYIDSAGDVKKSGFINIDEMNKLVTEVAKSTLETEFIRRWEDSEGRLIARLSNGRFFELGGDAAFLTVNDNVAAGDAGTVFREFTSGSGLAYRLQDKNGNDFLTMRNLVADKAVLIRQVIEINQVGDLRVEKHYTTETTTTANAQNVIFEHTLADNEHYDIKVLHAEATATDNTSINSSGIDYADVRKIAATNIESNNAVSTKSELGAATTANFNWNLDTVNQKIQYRFQNHSTGKTWSVFVVVSYTKRFTPTV